MKIAATLLAVAALALAPLAVQAEDAAPVAPTATTPTCTPGSASWLPSRFATTVTTPVPATVSVVFDADPLFRLAPRTVTVPVPAGTTVVGFNVRQTRNPNTVAVAVDTVRVAFASRFHCRP